MNKTWWWKAGFLIIGILLGTGVLYLVTRPPRGKPVELLPPPTPTPITVYVSGAVKQTGLYQLPPGSRVNDAIQAAGGFTDEADTSRINLAKFLIDGEQIDIPGKASPSSGGDGTRSINPSLDLVDINSASLEELDALPKIGPSIAQAIIDFRIANGPFEKINDIIKVDGIGQAIFEEIKDLITVIPASP